MKRNLMKTILAVIVVGAVGLLSYGGEPGSDTVHQGTASLFRKAPTIDGVISPGEWNGAIGTFGFQGIDHRTGLDARMGRTLCGFSKDRLYIAMISEVSPVGPLARKKNRDSSKLIFDSSIEIWLDPNRDTRATNKGDLRYYQIMVNSLGATLDVSFSPGSAPNTGWNMGYEYKASVDMKALTWTMEMSIPFKDIGLKGSPVGKSVGVLIARNYKNGWNQATWFPHSGSFVSWFQYPRIFMTADDPSVQIQSFGDDILNGNVDMSVSIYNPGPARKVGIDLKITSSDMPLLEEKKTIDLKAGSVTPYTFKTPQGRFHREAVHTMRFIVSSEDKKTEFMNYGLKWTNLEATMKKISGGKKWNVRVGSNLDAAVKLAYYPSYNFIKLKVNTGELDKSAKTIKSGRIEVRNGSGKAILQKALKWEKTGLEEQMKVGDLPDGEYTATITLDGFKTPFVRTFVRKHFPWEGNTLGISDKVYPPFTPIKVTGNMVDVVLRQYTVDGLGLWQSVKSMGIELLSKPMALVINGGTVLKGKGRFVSKKPAEVVYEGVSSNPQVTVKTRCTTEVDGCMKVEMDLLPGTEKKELTSLFLDIPIKDEYAYLWHVSSTLLRTNPVGSTPKGDGVIWDSGKYPDGEWFGNFKCYYWLGTEDKGLCWFADNDKGWVLDVNKGKFAPCQELIRKGDTLTLRINFIQKPVLIEKPRTIVFGLMATPGKPMPKTWRKTTLGRKYKDYPRIVWMGSEYWGANDNCSSKYPRNGDMSSLEMVKAIRSGKPFDYAQFIKAWEARNFKKGMPTNKSKEHMLKLLEVTKNVARNTIGKETMFNAYWEEFHSTDPLHEEVKTFKNEWTGNYGYGSTGAIVPSYRDFAVWYGAKFIRNGIGLYFDNAFPKRGYDPVTGSAYRLPNGEMQPSANMWNHREYLKRIWTIHRTEQNPQLPVIEMIHMTNTHIVPYMVWNESNLDLEWFYGPKPAQTKYKHDMLRAQSMGLQSGNIPLVLARIGKPKDEEEATMAARTRFGAMTVHEIKADPAGGARIDNTLYGILYDFGYGRDDCQVYNYWQKDYPLTVSDPECKTLLLKKDKKLLLLICTWNESPAKVRFSLNTKMLGLDLTQAVDPETQTAIPVKSGSFSIELKGFEVKFLELN